MKSHLSSVRAVSEVVMKVFKMSLMLMMAIFITAGVVSAAPARIASITDHIDGPIRVAVDSRGICM